MKTYTQEDLKRFGINRLTGEACAYAMRVLCDVNEDGKALLQDYLGLPVTAAFAENWNSQVNGLPSVGSIMLDRAIFDSLLRFALFKQGYTYLYGANNEYLAYTDEDLVRNNALRSLHEGSLSYKPDGQRYTNPKAYTSAPTEGSRNVHAASGRAA